MQITPEYILHFWFYEVGPDRWFVEDKAIDDRLRAEFLPAYEAAKRGDYKKFEETPEGMIALLLLVEYFPRRLFRGTAQAYDNDDWAVEKVRDAIIKHFDDRIDRTYKLFFYLPFQYSEHLGDQRLALYYIRERTKEDAWIDRADRCLDAIQRFGRFPERNEILGRESTPEEIEYIKGMPKDALFF